MDDDFGDDEDFGLGGDDVHEAAPAPQQLSSRTSNAATVEAAMPAAPHQQAQQDDFGADELYGDIHDALPTADSGAPAAHVPQPSQQAHQQLQLQQPAKGQQPQAAGLQPGRPPASVALPMQREGSSGAGASSVVFVGNLQWWTTDAELEAACAEFGPVSAVQFTEDKSNGRSKGYARVHFSDPAAAEQCKAGLSGREINGKACIVTISSNAPAAPSASPAAPPPVGYADRVPRPPFMGGRGGPPTSGFPGGRGPGDLGGMFRPGMPSGMSQGAPGRGMMGPPGMMGMGMPGHGMPPVPPGGGGGGMVAAGRGGGGMMGGNMMGSGMNGGMGNGMNGGMGGLAGGMRPFMGGGPGRGGMAMGIGPGSGMGPGGMGLPSPFTPTGGGLQAGMPGFDMQPDSKRRRL